MPTNEYRIIKTWDDQKGDWTYCLEINSNDDKGWSKTVYTGDGDWATREAEHYKCEIMEVKSDTNPEGVKL